MHGRTDSQQGAAVSRAGWQRLRREKSSGARLVPFGRRVVEFGRDYVRLYENVFSIISGWSFTLVADLAPVPWAVGRQHDLRFAAVGDVLFVSDTYSLTAGQGPWVLRWGRRFGPGLPAEGEAAWVLEAHRIGVPRWPASEGGGPMYGHLTTPQEFTPPPPQLPYTVERLTSPPVLGSYSAPDDAHPLREWDYLLTALVQHRLTGETAETLPVRIQSSTGDLPGQPWDAGVDKLGPRFVVYPDKTVELFEPAREYTHDDAPWDGNAAPAVFRGIGLWEVKGWGIYRGRGGFLEGSYGLIARLTRKYGTEASPSGWPGFLDDGQEPNYAISPPRHFQPFLRTLTLSTDYLSRLNGRWQPGQQVRTGAAGSPRAMGFFEGRLVLVGDDRPTTLWLSASGDFSDFDVDRPVPTPDMALEFTLAAYQTEAVRHLVPLRQLVVLTDTSIWLLAGAGGPLGPDSVQARLVDTLGAGAVAPLRVGHQLLVVRPSGRQVAVLAADGDGGYQAADVSVHARHLTHGRIRDWCYAESPWGVVWAVTEEGALLSCTLGSAAGWARHDSLGATFLSVCCVPEGAEDAVYALVRRSNAAGTYTQACIERLTPRDMLVTAGQCNVDNAVQRAVLVDITGTEEVTLAGLPRTWEGREVWLTTRRNAPVAYVAEYESPTTSKLTVRKPQQSDAGTGTGSCVAWLGLGFVCELETLDYPEGRLQQKSTVAVGVEVNDSLGLEVGQDAQHLSTWRTRRAADEWEYVPTQTELVALNVDSTWDKAARAFVRQALPRPLTVLGVTREVRGGGR